MARRAKIFAIGLNKTGTVSLWRALHALGTSATHFGADFYKHDPDAYRELGREMRRTGKTIVEVVDPGDQFEAYVDYYHMVVGFAKLDRLYPQSRFIMTTRDESTWLESRRQHVMRNRHENAAGTRFHPWRRVRKRAWRREKRRHEARVRAHFADRPGDLLVMDIPGGDGYESLCPFLGLQIPSTPFPRLNASVAVNAPPCVD